MRDKLEELRAKIQTLRQIYKDRVEFLERQILKLQTRSEGIDKFIGETIKMAEDVHDEYIKKEKQWNKEKSELEDKVSDLEKQVEKLKK